MADQAAHDGLLDGSRKLLARKGSGPWKVVRDPVGMRAALEGDGWEVVTVMPVSEHARRLAERQDQHRREVDELGRDLARSEERAGRLERNAGQLRAALVTCLGGACTPPKVHPGFPGRDLGTITEDAYQEFEALLRLTAASLDTAGPDETAGGEGESSTRSPERSGDGSPPDAPPPADTEHDPCADYVEPDYGFEAACHECTWRSGIVRVGEGAKYRAREDAQRLHGAASVPVGERLPEVGDDARVAVDACHGLPVEPSGERPERVEYRSDRRFAEFAADGFVCCPEPMLLPPQIRERVAAMWGAGEPDARRIAKTISQLYKENGEPIDTLALVEHVLHEAAKPEPSTERSD